jgi:hypothetical protein
MSAAEEPLDLDLVTASLRADRGDIDAFLAGLADKLEAAVPGRVRVTRGRRGLFGGKAVREIAVDSRDSRLSLRRDDGGELTATQSRISGGIALKTERLDTEAWLEQVAVVLGAEADRSARTREVLERLLLG